MRALKALDSVEGNEGPQLDSPEIYRALSMRGPCNVQLMLTAFKLRALKALRGVDFHQVGRPEGVLAALGATLRVLKLGALMSPDGYECPGERCDRSG